MRLNKIIDIILIVGNEFKILQNILCFHTNTIFSYIEKLTLLCVLQISMITQALISFAHDTSISSHRSIESTLKKLQWDYFWPRMTQYIQNYIKTCDACQCNKSTTQKPIGLLQSLPVPIDHWTLISIDFITHLPIILQGYDVITVIIDRFMKWAHFIPSKSTNTAEDFAYLLLREVIWHHRLPSEIISDHDTQFTSRF